MAAEEQKKYRPLPGIVMTRFGSEYYLVKARKISADRSQYLISMNEIAAFYWEQLDEPRTKDELISALCEEYDVPDAGSAEKDLERLMDSWIAAGCVEVCG